MRQIHRLSRSIATAWVMLIGSSLAIAAPANAADGLPEPIVWRQLAFSIPFKVPPAESADQQPKEIRLYVSNNQGASWDLTQTVSPQERSFVFRVKADGDYGFLIRTVDRQGRLSQEISGQPELRVIVDTLPPRLDLSATRGEAGELKANWQAVDPLLNVDSLKISYQTTTGQWRAVALERPTAGAPRSTTTGTLTWWPTDAPTAAMLVKAEVSDRAGNVTVSQAKIEPAPNRPSLPERTARSNPNSSPPQIDAPSSTVGRRYEPPPPGVSAQNNNGATTWPADRSTDVPYGRSPIPTTDTFRLPPDDGAAAIGRRTETVSPPIRNQVFPEIDRPPQRTSPTESALAAPGAPQNNWALPAGQKPRMVNSRSFDMEYEVDAIGPSGIAKVELWGTRDSGRTWTSYGVDSDNRSPMRVNAEGEGLYGFRIVVQSGNGLGGLPPRAGDQPELWVAVDLSKPRAQLLGATAGNGPQAGELVIRWEAADAALAARPITLLFSEGQGGPWSIIAAGLDNTGQYSWRPDGRVPERIYLRIEARDEAGNIGSADGAEPITLERIRPEGRLRGVRSVIDTATGGRIYEFYR